MKRAFVVAGLLFGDEGKGATTDFLTRRQGATMIVRYNGGPQNAHNVTTPEGQHHTFSQLGAGSFVPNVRTFISKYTLFDPLALVQEIKTLVEAGVQYRWDQISVDEEAVIVTPFHRTLNRLAEAYRGAGAHGSVGLGVGVARKDSIMHPNQILRAKHLGNEHEVMKRLKFIEELHTKEAHRLFETLKDDTALGGDIQWYDDGGGRDFLCQEYRQIPPSIVNGSFNEKADSHEVIIFEGGQGYYLDEERGFTPHVTWTNTRMDNANQMIDGLEFKCDVTRIGCIRPYATRHGRGPLPHELTSLSLSMPETHNRTGRWQGTFRHGCLDLDMVRGAAAGNGRMDALSISCMDRLQELFEPLSIVSKRVQARFENPGDPLVQQSILEVIEGRVGLPITIVGNGPSAYHRVERKPLLHLGKAA